MIVAVVNSADHHPTEVVLSLHTKNIVMAMAKTNASGVVQLQAEVAQTARIANMRNKE